MNPTPFGKYYLLEQIGAGGMAEVFRAKAFGVEGFERLVAVKRILPSVAADHEFIRMLIDEAKLAVQLNHANIAQILDLGMVDDSYYIALEHVHGRDLRTLFERCRQQGSPMPIAQACFIAMKICEGLDYAHNKRDYAGHDLQLVHRDVSPQHVLVSFDGEVKLIDFGVARAAGKGAKTQADILRGKAGYMSPEQVLGIVVDRRSDVFACGIVLYELLTGERLFVGETDFSTREKVRNVEILPPSTFHRGVGNELERIVLKALAKDPEERYQNAIDLHDELKAFTWAHSHTCSRNQLAEWMQQTFASELQAESAKLESYRKLGPAMVSTPGAASPTERDSTQPIPLEISQLPQSLAGTPVDGNTTIDTSLSTENGTSAGAETASASGPAGAAGGSDLRWEEDELDTQIFDDDTDGGPRRGNKGVRPSGLAIHVGGGAATEDLSATLQGWEGGPIVTMSPSIASALTNAGQATFTTPSAQLPAAAAPARVPALGPGPLIYATPVPEAPVVPPTSPAQPTRTARLLPYVAIGGAAFVFAAVLATVGFRSRPTPGEEPPSQAAADPDTGFDLYVTPAGVTTWRLDGDVRTDRLPSRIRGIAPGAHQLAIDAPPGFLSQRQTITLVQGTTPKIEIVLDPIAGMKGTFQSTPPGAKVTLIIDGSREPLGKSPATASLDPRKTYQVLFEMPGYVSVNRPIAFSGSVHELINVELEPVSATGGTQLQAGVHVEPSAAVAPSGAATVGPAASSATQVASVGNVAAAQTAAVPNVAAAKPAATPKTVAAATPAAASKAAAVAKPVAASKTATAAKSRSVAKPSSASNSSALAKPDTSPAKVGEKRLGTLFLGSKPPCEIFVDGASTGKYTPQKDLRLTAGKHRITLINTDLGVRESFVVDIRSGQVHKVIKDFSSKIQAK